MAVISKRMGAPAAALGLGTILLAAASGSAAAASASVSIVAPLKAYGDIPTSALVADQQGNLYGSISSQHIGSTSSGSLFSLAPDGSTTALYTFSDVTSVSGGYPGGSLVRTSDGSLYGFTSGDGYTIGGTIYRITADGQYSILHTFGARDSGSTFNRNPDGDYPAGLVQGSDGALYGTATGGGKYGLGTIFRITTDGQFSLLYTYKPYHLSRVNSYSPCRIIAGADGALYGGTSHASNGYYGSLFKLTLDGHYTELHFFNGSSSTSCPSLVQTSDGNFYGAYASGSATGAPGTGWIFRMAADGSLTSLHTFKILKAGNVNTGGALPVGLIQATDGTLYGIGSSGGSSGVGTLFSITTDGSFTNLYDFPSSLNGQAFGLPILNVTQGSDGALYGTVESADDSAPAVFRAVITN